MGSIALKYLQDSQVDEITLLLLTISALESSLLKATKHNTHPYVGVPHSRENISSLTEMSTHNTYTHFLHCHMILAASLFSS
jgi:predicted carbohydrate-binding protein with CBM5 and CBM33 domain